MILDSDAKYLNPNPLKKTFCWWEVVFVALMEEFLSVVLEEKNFDYMFLSHALTLRASQRTKRVFQGKFQGNAFLMFNSQMRKRYAGVRGICSGKPIKF